MLDASLWVKLETDLLVFRIAAVAMLLIAVVERILVYGMSYDVGGRPPICLEITLAETRSSSL